MILNNLSYVADETRFVGEVAFEHRVPDRRPGVIVFPDGGGLSSHAKLRARRLAAMGYVAMAADLYGGGLPAANLEEGLGWVRTLTADPNRLRARAAAARDTFAGCPQVDPSRIAAIGFCFGGTAALELARSGAGLTAAICFHGILTTALPAEAGMGCKILACLGADDPIVPGDQRAAFEREMNTAGADWQINLYGGARHSFTDPDADAAGWSALSYHEAGSRRSWQAMQDLLHEAFRE